MSDELSKEGTANRELSHDSPLHTARLITEMERGKHEDDTLKFYGDIFYKWMGNRWMEMEETAIRGKIYRFTEHCWVLKGKDQTEQAFNPNRQRVNDIVDALKSEAYMPQRYESPCWLASFPDQPPAREMLVCKNAMIHLPAFVVDGGGEMPCSPLFFNLNCLSFPFDKKSSPPLNWLAFLESAWPNDPQSVMLLQEWFGYCLTSDMCYQKIMLIYGPKRSGKSTIAKILSLLLGVENVASPTMSSLTTQFGLWPLVGKVLATIADARLSGRSDVAVIAERLLSISGEDAINVDRKGLSMLITRLSTKVMILSNELPKLSDASGALASRFVVLRMLNSFFGKEDHDLLSRLVEELPSILLWAIEGWKRLRTQGEFTDPKASQDAKNELEELSSPVAAFIRSMCVVEPEKYVSVDELYVEWKKWCEGEGRDHPGTKTAFGRDIMAAFPQVTVKQKRNDGSRERAYFGIGLPAPYALPYKTVRNRVPEGEYSGEDTH